MSRVKTMLFNTDMVRALLDGRKTVTRRIAKGVMDISESCPDMKWETPGHMFQSDEALIYHKAPYQPGDYIYVREKFCWCPCWDCGKDTEEGCCDSTAERFFNHEKGEYGCYGYKASFADNEEPFDKWHPSIRMPKEAARIWLKVTDVRVERLQDISNCEAKREGVVAETNNSGHAHRFNFMMLWNSTIKKSDIDRYGWDANPWVWVIEFERCDKPEGE